MPEVGGIKKIVDELAQVTQGLPEKTLISMDAKLFLNFEPLADLLPPARVILNCSFNSSDTELMSQAVSLRDKGYHLAINYYDGSPEANALLEHAEIVKFDFSKGRKKILPLRSNLSKRHILVADNLITWEEYEGAKAVGFEYFQGSFFGEAEIIKGQNLSSHRVSRLSLMSALSKADIDLEDVVKSIASDPSLAYRLLQFINSPAFGFKTQVESLKRAIALMGVRPLRSWAMLVLLADMDSSDKGNELVWNSLQRAIFLKLVSETTLKGNDPDKMFLLGMFSNIEAIIGLPLHEILNQIQLDDSINDALINNTGQLGAWIELLHNLDMKKQDGLDALLSLVGLSGPIAAQLYMRACNLASAALK